MHPPPPALLPAPSTNSDNSGSPVWTLDALFALPRARLKYYKKLYTRLLKSTHPGRSDHKLLTGAVEKLESLLRILAEREGLVIGQEGNRKEDSSSAAIALGSHSPLAAVFGDGTEKTLPNISGSGKLEDQTIGSVDSSVPPSSLSSEYASSILSLSSSN